MATGTKKEKRVKRGFWRRFFRFWLFLGLGFIGLILLLIIIVYLFFPPEYFKGLAIKTVREQFNRNLTIEGVDINLLKGIEFTDIALFPLEQDQALPDDFPVQSASIHKIILKYNIRELFHKRVVIDEIELNSPDIFINMIAPPQDTTTVKEPPADSLQTPVLPVSIALKQFRLQDTKFRMEMQDSLTSQVLYLADLDVGLDDIYVPQGDVMANDSALAAALELNVDKAVFEFSQYVAGGDEMSVTGMIALNSKVRIATLDSLDASLFLQVSDLEFRSSAVPDFPVIPLIYPITVSGDVHVLVEEEKVLVPGLTVKVGDETWLGSSIKVDGFYKQWPPHLSASVDKSRIPVQQLLSLGRSVLPDSMFPDIYFKNPNAAITFAGTRVEGTLPDSSSTEGLEFQAFADFLDFGLTLNQGQAELVNLNLLARSDGRLNFKGLQSLNATVSVNFDSVYYGLSDTLEIYTGKGGLNLEAGINEYMMPRDVELGFEVANVLGTTFYSHFTLGAEKTLQSITGNGVVKVSDIDTRNLVPLPLETTANLKLDIGIQTLDSISTHLDFATDSLMIPMQYETENFPPIHFTTNLLCGIDTLFQHLDIHNLSVKLNQILTASLNGTFDVGKTDFKVKLQDLALYHAPVLDWMPRRMKEQFASLKVTGATHVTANVVGNLAGELPVFDLESKVFTEQTSVHYPDQFISIAGIRLNVDAGLNSDNKADVSVSLKIDTTLTDNVRRAAFLDNVISLDVHSNDLKSFRVENGLIFLPELLAKGEFYANIENVDTAPLISATLDFHQNAEEPLQITRDIQLDGKTDLSATVNMDTALLDIFANVNTKDLTILLPAETAVSNINADLKVHQRMDLVKGIFLADKEAPIQTPTDGSIDYLAYRDYYRNSLENMSYLSIEKIKAAGYEIDNFEFEAVLGGGRVEIPSYMATVYDGNLGGRISVNLAGGNLAEATYNLSAHFSGINSDRLLAGLKRKESLGVINGNAQFEGTGVDPNEKLDIRGYFYITEIGSRVADNLLLSLDPEEEDSGIRFTRFLINQGYTPKLFTFEVRHGFMYTSIELGRPWYLPIKLEGNSYNISRTPLQFVIDRILNASTIN